MLEHIVTIYWYDRETDKWQKQMQQNEKAQQLFDLLRVNPYIWKLLIGKKWFALNSKFLIQGCSKWVSKLASPTEGLAISKNAMTLRVYWSWGGLV